ncbi:MAG: threonine--tRNA ligase, partial [Patescibacteria group bacterium]
MQNIENVRHSLSHLLAAAVLKKFPKAKFGIGPVIENGFYYDFELPRQITNEDLKKLESEMRKFIKESLAFSQKKISIAEAKKLFKDQPYKLELIKDLSKTEKTVSIYKTAGVFTDLCKGGHVKNTKEINADGFKLEKTAGAYWRGDEKNPMLTRIYGLAFATKKE